MEHVLKLIGIVTIVVGAVIGVQTLGELAHYDHALALPALAAALALPVGTIVTGVLVTGFGTTIDLLRQIAAGSKAGRES